MLKFIPRAAAALVLVSLASPALAWGQNGHAVIGLVAQHFLKPDVKKKVDALLASDTDPLTAHDIAAETIWADKFRNSDYATTKANFLHTHFWHVMELDLQHPDIDAACYGHPKLPAGVAASDGPEKTCVLDKIDQFSAELASPATKPAERLLALKYLIHLVGDLHEPLLVSGNHDEFGVRTKVSAGSFSQTSLRGFWDDGFIEELGDDPVLMADDLISGVEQSKSQDAIGKGTATEWALESSKLARDAYAKLPEHLHDGVYELEAPYITFGIETVRVQMARAGVRLAAVLNRALR